jgi:penicillin-binding protein 1A
MKKKTPASDDFHGYVKALWICVASIPVAIVFIFLLVRLGFFGELPSTEEITNPKSYLATEILSSDGNQIGTFFRENRVHVEYEEIPKNLINALVSTEDERFFQHSGIDFRSLGRALISLGSGGGGSTITQQLAKLMFTPDPARGILVRVLQKLKEWVIAIEIERRYTKQEILTMYLNKFDFLYQAVGIHSASNVYFGKNPIELNIEESALLVGMCKNPSYYNPARESRFELAKNRRNTVLGQLRRNEFINDFELDSLRSIPVTLNFNPKGHDKGLAPYLRENIRAYMKGWISKNPKADGERYNLYTDGLKIYTTIDSRIQSSAEKAVKKHMKNLQRVFFKRIENRKAGPFYFPDELSYDEGQKIIKRAMRKTTRYKNLKKMGLSEKKIIDVFNSPIEMSLFSHDGDIDTIMSPFDSIQYYKSIYQAGLLSVEPQTGFIKAWVGGVDFKHFKYDAVMQGKRQVGSTFKPFVYAAAIADKKYSPCMEVPNIQTCIDSGQFGLKEPWCPKNSNDKYGGVLTLKKAIAGSINTVTTFLMKQIGPSPVSSMVKSLGITSRVPVVPSIALGTLDLSVYELVGAYTAFGNKGLYTEPIVILRIEDKNGVLLEDFSPTTREVFSPEVAYTVVNLLEGVTESGTGIRLRHSGGKYRYNVVTDYPYSFTNPIAGKTGTTQNNSDGWFIGMVPNLITGIWTGCQDRSAHFGITEFGQGATTALPIWAILMKDLYTQPKIGISQGDFEKPKGPMSIALDCNSYLKQSIETDNEQSEYN